MSSVRALVPQKVSVEEELMHVKHVEVKSPHVGVMWKFGRGVISSGLKKGRTTGSNTLEMQRALLKVLSMRTSGDRDEIQQLPYHHERLGATMTMANARCQLAFTTMPPT
ncbi:hypothetical protein TNCV_58811 [Trichonephila clavipes]|nr:hypothetical protein TNCV_58811 [Trichonephila clavipes]